MSNVTEMKRLAYEIRIHVLDMLAEHSHGHVGEMCIRDRPYIWHNAA